MTNTAADLQTTRDRSGHRAEAIRRLVDKPSQTEAATATNGKSDNSLKHHED